MCAIINTFTVNFMHIHQVFAFVFVLTLFIKNIQQTSFNKKISRPIKIEKGGPTEESMKLHNY